MNVVQRKAAPKASLPGPKARALIERDKQVVSPSYVRDYPFVIQRGRGAEAWDVDGNRFVDFASGIAVCSTGHSHPDVVAAIKSAAEQFLHISCDYWHEGQVELASWSPDSTRSADRRCASSRIRAPKPSRRR